jgi:hemerythrin-like domain-containing protein
MTDLLDRLNRDHRALTRVLDLFDDLLDQFHAGSALDYELMCEMLEYIGSYSDQVHHPSEEDIFDRLRARTNEGFPLLDLLTKQHLQLSQMNKRFRQSLEGIMSEEVLRRDDVEVQGRELVKTLREHLELEETEAFPLARERLSESDWDRLLVEVPSDEDPLFGDSDHERFRSLFRHLLEQEQDRE